MSCTGLAAAYGITFWLQVQSLGVIAALETRSAPGEREFAACLVVKECTTFADEAQMCEVRRVKPGGPRLLPRPRKPPKSEPVP